MTPEQVCSRICLMHWCMDPIGSRQTRSLFWEILLITAQQGIVCIRIMPTDLRGPENVGLTSVIQADFLLIGQSRIMLTASGKSSLSRSEPINSLLSGSAKQYVYNYL